MTFKKFMSVLLLLTVTLGSCSGGVKQYKLKVVEEYPHDRSSYTQGLFFHDGTMYESTGQWGQSTFRKVELESGSALERIDFNKKYFVEGSSILDGKLYILTWTNHVAFVYDAATLKYLQSYSYPKEGWGLTTDGTDLIASDGSSNIYFLDGEFHLKKTISVKKDGHPIRYINELEYIDGKIWANVYLTDMILIIDPDNGNVEATVNCEGLLPAKLYRDDTDVLNGIAYDGRTKKIYLTGKNWPKLYQIELVRQ